jgi:anaerobic ribonucleoside-triphosphate reductase activating protein
MTLPTARGCAPACSCPACDRLVVEVGRRLRFVQLVDHFDLRSGQPFDKATRNEVFASCQPDYIAGLSLLGGEPMEPENQRELLPFVRNFKALYPNKTVWCYSGYTWEQLTGKEPSLARCEVTDELLSLLDVLVDGEFVQAKHDISLRFRGSSNQRLLDVKKTLAAGEPVWWEDEKVFATHTMETGGLHEL